MKKKIKIFSTIASLCLAVALMAFGVYAATQVTYTATSTVTFESKDVYVAIEAQAFKNAASNTTGATPIADAVTYYSYDTSTNLPNDAGKDNTVGTWKQDVKLDSVNIYAVYTFKITNNGANEVEVTIANNTAYDATNMEEALAITGSKIASGESATYTYAAKISNTTKGVTGLNVELVFTIK